MSNGDFLVVGGSDRKATLLTRDGIKLAPVYEGKDWIWRAVPRPKSNYVALGTQDGVIAMHSVVFSTVHGLYQDRYAFRGEPGGGRREARARLRPRPGPPHAALLPLPLPLALPAQRT